MIGTRNAEIALDLLVDVLQRRRHRHARLHGKAQPVRLAEAVVRVLAEDHHLHRVERRGIERGEDLRPRRKDARALALAIAQEHRE